MKQTKDVVTNEGTKKITVNRDNNSTDLASILETYMLSDESPEYEPRKTELSQHLLEAHYQLRLLEARDAKSKLLMCLNYFRSVQKRIAFDLREFATRDRVDGEKGNPFEFAKDGDQNLKDNYERASKEQQDVANGQRPKEEVEDSPKMTVFDAKKIE